MIASELTQTETPLVRAMRRTGDFLNRIWPILLVLAAFAATTLFIPTLAPVATTDDWGYSRSVEILVQEHRLTVFPVVAATAVFQIVWGALFALLFGMSLGVMRVATLTMVALGAVWLYALLRELGITRNRSALGAAAYLFNPLSFILSFTFMTDPYFTALTIGSSYGYVRGIRGNQRWLLIGSALAACAFLTRQQGAFIPAAVVTYLVFTRQLTLRRSIQVGTIPALAAVGYLLWLRFLNDVPAVQQSFSAEARAAGIEGTWLLSRNLIFIAAMYVGFFALPIAVGTVPALRSLLRPRGRLSWVAFLGWAAVLVTGLVVYGQAGKRWPYVPQFVGSGGLGPADVVGSRPRVFHASFFVWATVVCGVAAFVAAFVITAGIRARPADRRGGIGLVAAIAAWQCLGVLPPSFHYIRRGYSLDRYLLPLLPLAICLLLWAMSDRQLLESVGWLCIGVLLLFDVAATRDYLVFMDTVWSTASEAQAAGVELTKLDAGSGWDGYHLYTYGLERNITRARTRPGPWWTYFYAPATDSSYIVSSRPKRGYFIIRTYSYDSWLLRDSVRIFLLRKFSVLGPP